MVLPRGRLLFSFLSQSLASGPRVHQGRVHLRSQARPSRPRRYSPREAAPRAVPFLRPRRGHGRPRTCSLRFSCSASPGRGRRECRRLGTHEAPSSGNRRREGAARRARYARRRRTRLSGGGRAREKEARREANSMDERTDAEVLSATNSLQRLHCYPVFYIRLLSRPLRTRRTGTANEGTWRNTTSRGRRPSPFRISHHALALSHLVHVNTRVHGIHTHTHTRR